MISVDHNKNIQRIIDVIKANPNILRQNDTDGLLRSVQFGNPANMLINIPEKNAMPFVYITTSDSLQKTSYPFGISSSSNLSQVTVEYKIVIISDMDGKQVTAEKKLYNLLNLMRDTLTSDPTFKDPNSDDDPIFTRSIINQSQWNLETKGTSFQAIEFILICTIGVEQGITIPGVGFLPIIGITPDTDTENWQPHYSTEKLLKGYAPLGSIRTISILVIYNKIEIDAIRILKQNRDVIIVTFTDIDGTTQDQKIVISNISINMSSVDEIKSASIQFNIIP